MRLRLARAVVEDGWTVSYAAAVFQVAYPTAKRWALRYRQAGPAGMVDRSSRPHRCPRRTPRPVAPTAQHPGLLTCRNTGVRLCPRGDTVHTHTASAVKGGGMNDPPIASLLLGDARSGCHVGNPA
jgi:hypothetical protein